MINMTTCLNDLSYIPPNNEQNEPTQGDIGETSNEPTQAIRNKFEELYAIANEELLQRLYKSSHTAKEMTWHPTRKYTEPGKMQHPVDGRAWKNFDTKYPDFAKEPRNFQLGLAADGFNPFGNLNSSFMLTLLIPGPKSPGKDIDVYLRPLIDELQDLWAKPGVKTIDVATGQKFNMRAMVLWTINDFPTRSSLSGWSGQDGDPPRKFNRDDIMAQLARLPTRVKGKHPMCSDHPKIDMYQVKFKSQFSNKDMKEEFPAGLGRSRDERRTTQNNGICSPGKDGEMYYGQLEEILEFSYMSFKTLLFRVMWFDTSNKGRVKHLVIRNHITQILENYESFKNDQYILATQVKQCFYLEDMARRPLGWKVVEHVNHKTFLNGGVIMEEDDPDIIHVDNSSNLVLSTSLNDLEIAALHIDGQSIDLDVPPDIIDVDEDDDIIDDEDVLPHDIANSNDEDLVNVDDDNGVVVVYSTDVARGHDGDSGGDDRPPPHQIVGGCRGKGT
ncbi:RNA-directed DNA polymerase, eukaryota [Tanacetum coccineum]